MADTLLEVENLVTAFKTETGEVRPVDGVSFEVRKGKTLALVGESGSGKSVTSLSVMGLVPRPNGFVKGGSIRLGGEELLSLSDRQMRRMRGNRMAMIFQEPMTALNPVYTVAQQLTEVFRLHEGLSRKEAWKRGVAMLEKVRIPDPETRMRSYPHELSGGMRQRVMIAMALACNPELLIADEPTTALDVTIQAQVLRLMRGLQSELGTAILFITHDLGVVAEMADEVAVMYAGQLVERASVEVIFRRPRHPYTQGLLGSLPKLSDAKDRPLTAIRGIVPALDSLPKGCRFAPRCPRATAECIDTPQQLKHVGEDHQLACKVAEASDGSVSAGGGGQAVVNEASP